MNSIQNIYYEKIIISILIPSYFLCFTGCYTMREVSKEEFKNQSNTAILLTNKMETYRLYKGQYYIKADTVYGKGSQILNGGIEIPSSKQIPLDNISLYSIKESDEVKTVLAFIGITAGVVLILYTILVAVSIGQYSRINWNF